MERYLSQSLTIVRNYSVRMSLVQEEIKTILDFWKFPNLKYVESLVYTAFQIHNIWFMRMEYIISNIDSEQNACRQWYWWQRYVGDFMMVTDLRYWWQNHYDGDFFDYLGDFFLCEYQDFYYPNLKSVTSISKRSPRSQFSQQHEPLPTYVTNICHQHPSPTST